MMKNEVAKRDDETRAVMGRPTKYLPQYADIAAKANRRGATTAEIAELLSINEATVRAWCLQHPDFSRAMRVGKKDADERVKRSLYERALGGHVKEQQAFKVMGPDGSMIEVVEVEKYLPADTRAAEIWLRNRDPNRWKDKREVEHSGTVTLKAMIAAAADVDGSEDSSVEAGDNFDGTVIDHDPDDVDGSEVESENGAAHGDSDHGFEGC